MSSLQFLARHLIRLSAPPTAEQIRRKSKSRFFVCDSVRRRHLAARLTLDIVEGVSAVESAIMSAPLPVLMTYRRVGAVRQNDFHVSGLLPARQAGAKHRSKCATRYHGLVVPTSHRHRVVPSVNREETLGHVPVCLRQLAKRRLHPLSRHARRRHCYLRLSAFAERHQGSS